jgi:hypothetical protein
MENGNRGWDLEDIAGDSLRTVVHADGGLAGYNPTSQRRITCVVVYDHMANILQHSLMPININKLIFCTIR